MNKDFILQAIKSVPAVYPYLSRKAQKMAVKAFDSYESLRSDYWAHIYDAVDGYLNSNRPITGFRNTLQGEIEDYFQQAAELGYQDGGAELPLSDVVQGQVDNMVSIEVGNIDSLFQSLRDNSIADYTSETFDRANGYAATLDSVYQMAKAGALGDQEISLTGDDGKESCADCQTMKDQWHPASWWIENDMIPRPGNPNYACGGWNCQHYMIDRQGNEYKQS